MPPENEGRGRRYGWETNHPVLIKRLALENTPKRDKEDGTGRRLMYLILRSLHPDEC
ncbi:MAG TPA: hypothetical protein PKW51_09145 [Methanoregulaceae archaeon]|nr:hypothetical protein [Methanoregulaceae archaeon]